MTDHDTLQALAVVPSADEGAPIRHRATFTARDDDTVAPGARPDDQELHPVPDTLIAPDVASPSTDHTGAQAVEPLPAESDDLVSSFVAPRPASVPSHRADVDHDDIVPNDIAEPRPASAARHSVDTSAIPLPVFPVAVDPSLPQPPERLTLDDDDLVRIIERRLDDTAAVDLLAVVQAQLSLRAEEAARFASWEDEISRIGSAEAVTALEQTRLRFTGIVPVQAPITSIVDDAPEARVDTSAAAPAPESTAGPSRAPAVAAPVHTASGPATDVLAHDAPPAPASSANASATDSTRVGDPAVASRPGSRAPRLLVVVALAAAGAVVLLALVLALVGATGVGPAVLATAAVPVAAALAGVAALRAVASRPSDADRVARRGPAAVVAGVVVGSAVGCGVLVSDLAAFAWQGYLVRLVGFTGVSPTLGVVLGLVAAAAVSFVVAVLLTGLRSTPRVEAARD